MRRGFYRAGLWVGVVGGLSYAVEAGVLTVTGQMRDAAGAGGWALLGAAMAMAAILRRRALPGTTEDASRMTQAE